MNRYKLSTLLKMCLVVISSLALITACEKADKLDTNQLGGSEVLLRSFGPCPIQRGAELRIIGANLDKVESVTLPGCGAISDIKRISTTEIRIIIPQNADPGVITLTAGNQQITSISALVFNEPITLTSITPLTAKAGDVVKIEGDYLNLIEEIIFWDDVHVLKADFISQSRQEIDVTVPQKAQTGKIIVSNGADIIPDASGNVGIPIWVYSDSDLVVVLPTISKISPNPVKAGDLLTITGTNFDLVDSVVFGGNVGTRDYIGKTATEIQVNVPENAADGDVKLLAFSGLAVSSADSLIMVVPTINSIAPNPVKNGGTLTVTGTNLDLVSSVVFGGSTTGTIATDRTATSITVSVPIDASPGAVTFNTLANKSVQSAVLNFVQPAITSVSASSIIAGDKLTIEGTDLDLVTGVQLVGNAIDTTGFVSQTATQLIVQSSTGSLTGTGNLVLVTTNGSQITYTQQITINTPNIPAVTSITPSPVTVGNMISIVGTKLNLVESILFENSQGGTTKATQYGSRTETLIEVYVPLDALAGTVTFTMSTYDGTQYTSPSFEVKAVETDLWTGNSKPMGWNTDASAPIDASKLAPGQTLGFDIVGDPNAGYWQIEAMTGSWWIDFENWAAQNGGANQPSFDVSKTNIEIVITQTDIDNIKMQGSAVVLAGNGYIITRVYVKD